MGLNPGVKLKAKIYREFERRWKLLFSSLDGHYPDPFSGEDKHSLGKEEDVKESQQEEEEELEKQEAKRGRKTRLEEVFRGGRKKGVNVERLRIGYQKGKLIKR